MKSKAEDEKIIKVIGQISSMCKNVGIVDKFILDNSIILGQVSKFLGITNSQSLIFSVFFSNTFLSSSMSIKSLASYLDVETICIADYLKDIDFLVKKHLIRQIQEFQGRRKSMTDYYIEIPQNVVDAILRNVPPTSKIKKVKSINEFVSVVLDIINEKGDNVIDNKEMWNDLRVLFKENSNNLEFVEKSEKLKLSITDMVILILLFDKHLSENCSYEVQNLQCLFNIGNRDLLDLKKSLLLGTSDLVVQSLVKLEEGFFVSDKNISLTDKGLQLFYGKNNTFINQKKLNEPYGFISSDKIPDEKLFYNQKEKEQLDKLAKILDEDNYSRIQKDLKSGLNILFHGDAGTGKTAAALALSRRGIGYTAIDVSTLRSKFYGESERILKSTFTNFKQIASQNLSRPFIIILNEADSLLSVRLANINSSLDQTANTLQNILLEELETPNFFFIAISNLITNFDLAFQRRFNYRIKFERPTFATRLAIIQDKFPQLKLEECHYLSKYFEFTGAEIWNVSKRCIIQNIITNKPNFEDVIELFKEEKLKKDNFARIGFELP